MTYNDDDDDDYKLLNSSFLLLQSMGGAFLPDRFIRALSLASATDNPRPRLSISLLLWRNTHTHRCYITLEYDFFLNIPVIFEVSYAEQAGNIVFFLKKLEKD